MKTIRNVLFASMLLFAFSCEKESDVTGIEDPDSVSLKLADFQTTMDVLDSGIDMEAYKRSLPTVEVETPKGFQNDKVKIEFNSSNAQSRVADFCIVDFENGIGDGVAVDSPLDANTNNGIFSPGDIPEGVFFDTQTNYGGDELALWGTNGGFTSKVLIANYYSDFFNINFTIDVYSVSFDVVTFLADGPVLIEYLLSSGSSGSFTVAGTQAGSTTLGMTSFTESIIKITLSSPDDLAEGIDNLAFNGNCVQDADGDGIVDDEDNCPNTPNADQANNDGDAEGDACDPDDDNDGVLDVNDNCQFTYNPGQANYDGDSEGDVCDDDDDNDGCPDSEDPHPFSIQSQTVVIGGCDTGVANQALGCSTMADILMDSCLNSGSSNAYIVSVYRTLQGWLRAGIINRSQQTAIYSCAVRNYNSCSPNIQ